LLQAWAIMWDRRLRPMTCHICGSTEIHAPYRSNDVIYLACEHCGTVWPFETPVSETPISAILTRMNPKHDWRVNK
jgi:uncharacterized Zn finger protein